MKSKSKEIKKARKKERNEERARKRARKKERSEERSEERARKKEKERVQWQGQPWGKDVGGKSLEESKGESRRHWRGPNPRSLPIMKVISHILMHTNDMCERGDTHPKKKYTYMPVMWNSTRTFCISFKQEKKNLRPDSSALVTRLFVFPQINISETDNLTD